MYDRGKAIESENKNRGGQRERERVKEQDRERARARAKGWEGGRAYYALSTNIESTAIQTLTHTALPFTCFTRTL